MVRPPCSIFLIGWYFWWEIILDKVSSNLTPTAILTGLYSLWLITSRKDNWLHVGSFPTRPTFNLFMKTTIEQVWDFLMNKVKPFGEFRIHTNKEGIRLYIYFTNPIYTGRVKRFTIAHNVNGKGMIHYNPSLTYIQGKQYGESIVRPTLEACYEAHMERMPKDKLFEEMDITDRMILMPKEELEDVINQRRKALEHRLKNRR